MVRFRKHCNKENSLGRGLGVGILVVHLSMDKIVGIQAGEVSKGLEAQVKCLGLYFNRQSETT